MKNSKSEMPSDASPLPQYATIGKWVYKISDDCERKDFPWFLAGIRWGKLDRMLKMIASGKTIQQAASQEDVSTSTYYRWKRLVEDGAKVKGGELFSLLNSRTQTAELWKRK